MSKPFPTDHPFLNGHFAPIHFEADASDLPVTGTLPAALEGTLYRIGPNPQFAPRGRYDWFAGDGMLHEFRLEGGRASYRNRWVRTPKWELEHAAGEALSAGTMSPSPLDDPRIVELRSTVANTNVVVHAGHLLALEEVHAPFELDATSLAAKGYQTFGGDLVGAMTAHPKIDPRTGQMLAFAYMATGPGSREVRFHQIDSEGRLERSELFSGPFGSMIHDFSVTQRHVVFPIFPLVASIERAMKGRPLFAWEPERGNHIGIMRRDGGVATMRWFRGDASYVYHPLNAYDTDDGRIVCDMIEYDVPPGYLLDNGQPAKGMQHGARLVRWTFDMNGDGDTYTQQRLSELPLEFPRVDDRVATLPHRHGFFVSGSANVDVGKPSERSSIAHIDLHTGAVALWQPEIGDFVSEPVFVPRSAEAPEGDGWLLTVVYRGADKRSDLAVLDTRDIAAGPVALVHLSHRVPAGFHGNWHAGPALP